MFPPAKKNVDPLPPPPPKKEEGCIIKKNKNVYINIYKYIEEEKIRTL